MTPARGSMLVAILACVLAGPALAQDVDLSGSLKFSGAPTPQEIQAQQKVCESKKPPRKSAGALNEGTYRRLERATNAIAKNQYADAEKILTEMAADGGRSDYEKAIILQTLGYVYASTKREDQGVKAFEQAIATNALPQAVHEALMFNVAQLYIGDDKYDVGMQKLNAYLAESCNPNPDAHILLASVHAEKKQWREALKQADLAVVKVGKPKESWLQLKLALHYELKEYPRCAEVLIHLVALDPVKPDYFRQLSGMLLQIGKDPEALAVLALAERRGLIEKENEYRNLAALYMNMQIPLKAAQAMERGIAQKQVPPTEKNYDQLATAWFVAREYAKSEAAMAKAAQASDKGEMYKRLAQIQMETENWKGALDSLLKAQKKGGLKDPGETALLAGVCAFQLKQWKTAEASLRTAMGYEKSSKIAAQWLNHLQDEVAYIQQQSGNGSDDSQTN